MRVLNLCFCIHVASNLGNPMLEVKWDYPERMDALCRKATENPFFKQELVFGKKWKIYYIWEHLPETKFTSIQFTSLSRTIKEQVRNRMSPLLRSQPNWNAPGMIMYVSKEPSYFVLLADEEVPGKYDGVQNIKKKASNSDLNSLPLIKFRMTLLNNGYLLMSECNLGWTLLTCSKDPPPSEAEIEEVATPLKLGDGFHTYYMS